MALLSTMITPYVIFKELFIFLSNPPESYTLKIICQTFSLKKNLYDKKITITKLTHIKKWVALEEHDVLNSQRNPSTIKSAWHRQLPYHHLAHHGPKSSFSVHATPVSSR